MMHCLSLVAGHWIEAAAEDREPGRHWAPETLVWLVGDQLSEEDRALVRRWLEAEGVPTEASQRLVDEPRAHLERADRYIALVLDTASIDEQTYEVTTGHVLCLLARGVIVTVSPGACPLLRDAEDDVRRQVHSHGREAGLAVLGALLTNVLADVEDAEQTLSRAINDLEQQMFSTRSTDPVERIYTLKRQVSKADYVVGALARPLERLTEAGVLDITEHSARSRMRRLTEWAHRLSHLLDADDRMLGDMLQVHLSQVSVRQNEDMRKISAWAGLVAVPTLISGVYGMNFTHMWELTQPWGYPVVLAVMAGVCIVLYRVFKKSGWL